MEIHVLESARAFNTQASRWLQQDEGINAVALGIIATQLSSNPRYKSAYYATVSEIGKTVGTAIMTPPYPFNINADSIQAVPAFVQIAKQFPRPKSVLGPGQFAQAFAKRWCQTTSGKIGHSEAQAIHALEKVAFPPLRPNAKLVLASSKHQSLLESWGRGFCLDCHLEDDIAFLPEFTQRVIEEQSRYLLTINEEPVSMAGRARETENGGTVNWVYTPPELRGRGYASELVARLSQTILEAGKRRVFLYTQLANPTSNKIYANLGFRVIADSWHIHFDYPE